MDDILRRRCACFAENYDRLHREFRFEYQLVHAVTAYAYAQQGRTLDLDDIETCRDLLRQKTSPFSCFRSAVQLMYAGALSLEADPNAAFDKTLHAYAALKEHFMASESLPLAAFAMARAGQETAFETTAALAREIYDAMRADHPFLTGREDIPFAVLFACCGKSAPDSSAATENAFTVLRTRFGRSDAVQTASHCLALCGDPIEGAKTLESLWLALRERKCRYGKNLELIGLAALAMSPAPDAGTVEEIDAVLKPCRGMGNWSIGAQTRLMYAALLASTLPETPERDATLPVTVTLAAATVQMIARQQAAATA